MGKRILAIIDITASSCIIVTSAAVLWAIVAGGVASRRSIGPGSPESVAESVVENVEARQLHVSLDKAEVLYPNGSSVFLIEFSDFQCPFCRKYARETLPQVKRELIDTKRVGYAFFNFPLGQIHQSAMSAAQAATCAGKQHRFWQMHDLLFGDNKLAPDLFVSHAGSLGLDIPQFQSCVESTRSEVRGSIELGSGLGVTSTPTFFVGRVENNGSVALLRRISGAHPYNVFKTALDEFLQGRGRVVSD